MLSTRFRSWIVACLSPVTFAFAVASIAHCSFLLVSQSSRRRLEDKGSGLFGWSSWDDGCVPWDLDEESEDWQERFDETFHAARSMGVVTALLTGLSLLAVILLLVPRIAMPPKYRFYMWTCVRVCFAMATVTEALTLILTRISSICEDFYSNAPYCKLGPMGYLALVNLFLLFIGTIAACRTPHTSFHIRALFTRQEPEEERVTRPTRAQQRSAFLNEFKLRRLPYGPFVLMPITLVSLGWSFAMVATFSCRTVKVCFKQGPSWNPKGVPSVFDGSCFSFGYKEEYVIDDSDWQRYFPGEEYRDYWNWEGPGVCSESAFAPDLKKWLDAGYAMGIIATALGAVAFLLSLSTLFLRSPRIAFVRVAWLCLATSLLSAAVGSFPFFSQYCDGEHFFGKGNDQCKPGLGASLAFCGVVLWLGAAACFFYLDRFERSAMDPSSGQGQATEREEHANTIVSLEGPTKTSSKADLVESSDDIEVHV